MLKKCRWLVNNFEEIFIVSSLGMITICMFAQVISRYVFNASLVWTEELSRYFFILLAFSGLSYGIRNKAHLRIDLFETFIPKLKKPFEYFTDVCFAGFCILMLRPAHESVLFLARSGQVSPALEIPIFIIYIPLAVGLVLCLLRIAEKYIKYFWEYKNSGKIAEEAQNG